MRSSVHENVGKMFPVESVLVSKVLLNKYLLSRSLGFVVG